MNSVKPLVKRVPVTSTPLNPTDLEVMQYILEMRFLTPVQIQKKFFKGTSGNEKDRSVTFTLDLINKGYLKIYRGKELEHDSLIMATEKAHEKIAKANEGKLIPRVTKSIFPFGVNHDIMLTDLRIRFEELNFVQKWVSDAHMAEQGLFLQQFDKDRPDAVVKKPNGKAYFLELEKAKKAAIKYRERIEHYIKVLGHEDFKKAQIEGVIFFCIDDAVVDIIKSQIPKGVTGISVLKYSKYFSERKKAPKPAEPEKKIVLEKQEKVVVAKQPEPVHVSIF